MIKKFVAWVKALFAPAKIEDAKVDEYIAKQSQNPSWERHIEKSPAAEKVINVTVVPSTPERVAQVEADLKAAGVKVPVEKTPPKPLNEQLKGVELPAYAKGKTLPPKAKREYIKRAGSPAPARRLDDTPHSTGGHVASHGIDPVNSALYGYAAATILNDDTPAAQPAPVEECRTSHYDAPSYTPSYDSTPSYSSPSYDSPSSYDGGYSGGSCD